MMDEGLAHVAVRNPKTGRTPLHVAAESGNSLIIPELLDHESDKHKLEVDARDLDQMVGVARLILMARECGTHRNIARACLYCLVLPCLALPCLASSPLLYSPPIHSPHLPSLTRMEQTPLHVAAAAGEDVGL